MVQELEWANANLGIWITVLGVLVVYRKHIVEALFQRKSERAAENLFPIMVQVLAALVEQNRLQGLQAANFDKNLNFFEKLERLVSALVGAANRTNDLLEKIKDEALRGRTGRQ